MGICVAVPLRETFFASGFGFVENLMQQEALFGEEAKAA
jgi:hypothetical protein